MLPHLTSVEARIIGCLMEKSVVTPDLYPLTLNALTNACNQKSARDPVMALQPGEVQRGARALQDRSLLHVEENFRTGAQKYRQRLCNTQFNDLQLDSAQFAILTLLLLRGAQTPGELRARSGRLHEFADNPAVIDATSALMSDEDDALLVQLPRTPGRRDAEYMHQLSGPVDVEAHRRKAAAGKADSASDSDRVARLQQRIRELEEEVANLKAQLAARPQA